MFFSVIVNVLPCSSYSGFTGFYSVFNGCFLLSLCSFQWLVLFSVVAVQLLGFSMTVFL